MLSIAVPGLVRPVEAIEEMLPFLRWYVIPLRRKISAKNPEDMLKLGSAASMGLPKYLLKMNYRTGEIAVVMTNRNPGVDQTESGVEWLADRIFNVE